MNLKHIFYLFICLNVNLQAQNFRVTHYTNDEGLQNELVKAIEIDSLGVIWIGTDEGLISYNGLNFNQFVEQLPSNYVKSVFKTSSGSLLCVTDLGAVRVVAKQNTADFTLIKAAATQVSDTALWYPKQLYEDSQHNIWLSDNTAIWKLNNGNIKRYSLPKANLSQSWHRSFSFAEDGFGHLFAFSHPGNLFIYDSKKDCFNELIHNQIPEYVSHCISFAKGKILVAKANGVFMYIFDEMGNLLETKTVSTQQEPAYLEKRNDNEVWIGTWINGLFLLKNINSQPECIKIQNYKPNIANCLVQNSNGDLWVGGDNGIALVQENYCDAPYQEQTKECTQTLFLKSAHELYFTDGQTIFMVDPQYPYLSPKKLVSKIGKFFLAFTTVNGKLWAADASGCISIFEDDKIVNTLNLSKYGGAIFSMLTDKNNNVWLCQDDVAGIIRIDKALNIKCYAKPEGITSPAACLTLSPEGKVYAGGRKNANFLFVYNSKEDRFINLSYKVEYKQAFDIVVRQLCFHKKTLWMATTFGLFKYENLHFARMESESSLTTEVVKAVTVDQQDHLWFGNSSGLIKFDNKDFYIFDETCGLPSKTIAYRGMVLDSNNQIWVGTVAGLGFIPNKIQSVKTQKPYFIYIQNDEKNIAPNQNSFLNSSLLKFRFVASSFPSKQLLFQWKLVGKNDDWQNLESLDGLFFSNLPTNNYSLEIRCRQHGNFTWSDSLVFKFNTHTAWYNSWWAYCIYLILLVLLIWFIVKYYTYRLLKQKVHLEQVVKERTSEVFNQKNEIEEKNNELNQANEELHATLDRLNETNEELNQANEELRTTLDCLNETNEELNKVNDELNSTLEIVNTQKSEIEQAHKKITDSIVYAKRIQKAVLPNRQLVSSILSNYFILFKPRDIISGDFYFIKIVRNYLILAVADCTGHGVPGAFMSMLGIAFLNEIVRKQENNSSDKILNELRVQIKNSLQQTGKFGEQQDGMDIAICTINLETMEMSFAGAYNPCLIYRKRNLRDSQNSAEVFELPADRQPVGICIKEKPFTEYKIQLLPNDIIYLFSDGYYSQFGGEKHETLKSKKFRTTLSEIYDLPMHEQKIALENKLMEWQGTNLQTDDVLVVGVKI